MPLHEVGVNKVEREGLQREEGYNFQTIETKLEQKNWKVKEKIKELKCKFYKLKQLNPLLKQI